MDDDFLPCSFVADVVFVVVFVGVAAVGPCACFVVDGKACLHFDSETLEVTVLDTELVAAGVVECCEEEGADTGVNLDCSDATCDLLPLALFGSVTFVNVRFVVPFSGCGLDDDVLVGTVFGSAAVGRVVSDE